MSNASSPNSINQLKHLNLASSLSPKKSPAPQTPKISPETPDAVEISPNGKEIGDLPRLDLKKMSPQELLGVVKKLFLKFDLNGDGNVSAREANRLGIPKETFDRYDADGNNAIELREEFAPGFLRDLQTSGQISMGQYMSGMKEIGGIGLVMKGFLQIFNRVDLNKDGTVSADEAQKLGIDGEKFKSWDTDGDGKVSLLGEYLPKVVDGLRDEGVLNDREHDKLMTRIKNAAQGDSGSDPDADRSRTEARARKIEDPIQVREHAERWLRGRDLDVRSLEDLGRRLFRK